MNRTFTAQQETASGSSLRPDMPSMLELVEGSGSIFLNSNPTAEIEYLSPVFFRFSGKSPDYLGTLTIMDLFPNEEEETARVLSELRQGKSMVKHLLVFPEGLNSECDSIEFTFRPKYNTWGDWAGIEGIGIPSRNVEFDQNKQKGLESRLAEAERIKDRFLSNISHEIRTPLNGILGMVQLLQNTRLDYEQKEFLSIVAKSGENLLQTLNQLIDLSLDISGKLKIQEDEIETGKLFGFISSLYAEQAILKSIDLDFQIKGEIPKIISDEFRIQQTLKQLISNSLAFTDQGNILVSARLESSGDKHFYILEVSDSGKGIEIERQPFIESILRKDGKAESSFNNARGGLGLLTIRIICEALRAEPGFVSAPGKGSTFWVKIPVKIKEIRKEALTEDSTGTNSILRKISPRVLLADDNAVNLKVASEILSRAGCRVVLASNGKEALEKASREFFHLILMDIQMPVMDGLEATRKIQELNLDNPPAIIAMTAYVMNEDKKRFLEAGMDDFIPKPISGDKILSKVRHWTEKSLLKNPLSETLYKKQEMADNQLRRIFDFGALKNLKKHLGVDILLASLEDFAIELREILNLIEAAGLENNLEELQRCFHTLKGNSGTFGLIKMAEIARELEIEVKNGNIANAMAGKVRLEDSANDFLNSYTLLYSDYEWKN